MKQINVVGFALAILCSGGFANAQVIESSLSSYSYELVDLDVNDGIAPSITFSNSLRGAAMSTALHFGAETAEHSYHTVDGTGVSLPGGVGHSSANTGFWIDNVNDYFFAVVMPGKTGYVNALAGWEADYSLSANTKLVFTGHAKGSFDIDPSVATQFGAAHVTMRFSPLSENDALPFYSRSVSSLDAASGIAFDEWFTLELVNDSLYSLDSHLSLSTQAVGGVTAVPEPSTYLMLGSGLLLTAAALRRRRVPKAN